MKGQVMKGDAVFKKTFNQILEYLAEQPLGDRIASETTLHQHLGASRTTIRKALSKLNVNGIISPDRILLRLPATQDSFDRTETLSTSTQVEKKFMEWMLRADRKPGDVINELDLARQFGVSTSGIREYLNRFSRFRMIERRTGSGWCFMGFTREFALELFEVREMFEMRSALAFVAQRADAPAWKSLKIIQKEHLALQNDIVTRYHDFSDLDERFHRLVNDASHNRFIVDFYDVISLIFHYHYQWNKSDEAERNRAAIVEHMNYIDALFSLDPVRVEASCRAHLYSARKTLLASVGA
ncbi:MAG: GntR family transcriptional regulator [Paracoccaceae bacterium]